MQAWLTAANYFPSTDVFFFAELTNQQLTLLQKRLMRAVLFFFARRAPPRSPFAEALNRVIKRNWCGITPQFPPGPCTRRAEIVEGKLWAALIKFSSASSPRLTRHLNYFDSVSPNSATLNFCGCCMVRMRVNKEALLCTRARKGLGQKEKMPALGFVFSIMKQASALVFTY